MTPRPRWERCVNHRGAAAEAFIREYFGLPPRKVRLIAGAGFDLRSTRFAETLKDVGKERVSGFFLREERPSPDQNLLATATENEARLRQLFPGCAVEHFDIFAVDNAPIGGRHVLKLLNARLDMSDLTDLVLDCSALSAGVCFSIAKFCYERGRASGSPPNVHLVVIDDPETDGSIASTHCGKPSAPHGFQGTWTLDASSRAARLWIPQLGRGKRPILELVHQFITPHAVCPILPFPATHPRFPDSLIEEYGDLFETPWLVDDRDLVYAHEKSPLDLYRTILRIDDARRRVFEGMGGHQVILSPVGSKALALGMLMAALEREFAVVSVETMTYKLSPGAGVLSPEPRGELVHIWLCGEAYANLAGGERA
jgi:hypothetical protein